MSVDQDVRPHVAEKIEPGAILYASWGYDQTNIDFYYVTRATAKSCWIVPMSHGKREPSPGFSPMSEHVMPGEPVWFQRWCECRHPVENVHTSRGCRGDNDACECSELRPVPNVPEMHRIRRTSYGEFVTLTSYSSAKLWDGRQKYASHYA